MIRMIAACSSNGVIGVDNKIPFHYSEDLQHFKKSTNNGVIIMGRKTFESIGSKPLPNRRNIVITRNNIENIETYASLQQALDGLDKLGDIWLIGGANIYQEGMQYVEEIVLTITPDHIDNDNSIRFPWINPLLFRVREERTFVGSPIKIIVYKKLH